ncbi:response regulator transcription factor [Aliikangiella marina]|uniref:Response regulator transcription factor n=1 Tax=Aliikangiella marina TaxID=1712262 RepID=A0A545T8Z8_9GAMM|nr:winged helix-turn-helix domain-containing protein [Aliikangiella marina]TQV73692.1 response regulator transcription factor [Aliikangiella marina]
MTLTKFDIQKTLNKTVAFNSIVPIGNFDFDEDYRVLRLNNHTFELRNKLFSIMSFLAYSDGKLIPRDVIINSIWRNNEHVGQKSLTHSICMLRKIFNQDPEQSVQIITISKTGYRLVVNNVASAITKEIVTQD